MRTQYAFNPKENQSQAWYYFENGFSKDELNKIERDVSYLQYERASVEGDNYNDDRKSNIKWIPQDPNWDWLYHKLGMMAIEANDNLWNFDINTMPEQIQYTEYHGSENGKYDWHQDIGGGQLSTRKISITVQLSDSEDYEGGDLCFWMGGSDLESNMEKGPRGAGNVVLFPSYLLHSVKPVTKGVRKSFVLWLGGGHYK